MTEGRTAGTGFGHLLVERSGGIGGFLLVWDVDIDTTTHPEELGERVAELPWPSTEDSRPRVGGDADGGGGRRDAAGSSGSADRYVYLIESRFGRARFGEQELTGEWKELVERVREVAEPRRRRPGAN